MTTLPGRLPIGLLLALGAVIVGGSLAVVPSLAGSLTLVAASLLTLALLVHKLCRWPDHEDTARRIARWTAGAFAGHLGVGLLISSSASLTTYFGGDANQYHSGALGIVAHWVSGLPMPPLPVGKEGFYYLLAGIYWVLGPSRLPGLIVNAALAAALVPVMSALTYELFGPRPVRVVPVLVTLLPGFILWPSQLLREAGVYFFTAVALLAAARLSRRVQAGPILVMAGALALLSSWRSYIALMAAGLIVALVGASRGLAGVGAGIGGLLAAAALVVGLGLGYSGVAGHDRNRSGPGEQRPPRQRYRSGEWLPSRSRRLRQLGWATYPLHSPIWPSVPFHGNSRAAGSSSQPPTPPLGGSCSPAWSQASASAGVGSDVESLVLITPALAVAIVTALIVANFGTMIRARMQLVIILVPLVALGWSERHGSGDRGWQSARADEASIVASD